MNSLQRLVGLATVVVLAAALLFAPRKVLVGNKYPFMFGDSLNLKFPIDTNQLLIELAVVIVVGGGLYVMLGRR